MIRVSGTSPGKQYNFSFGLDYANPLSCHASCKCIKCEIRGDKVFMSVTKKKGRKNYYVLVKYSGSPDQYCKVYLPDE